jgi:hypothetical protein
MLPCDLIGQQGNQIRKYVRDFHVVPQSEFAPGKRPHHGLKNRERDMDYRSPRIVLAQFLPAYDFHSREIRRSVTKPTRA